MLGWPETTERRESRDGVYVAYFAFLFLMPRWWRQTEYTRESRLSLWRRSDRAFAWAWLLHIFWWFPQPLGMMAAGVIALCDAIGEPLDAAQPAPGAE